MSCVEKKQLVEIAGLMYQKGMANAYEGNASCFSNNKVFVTPSGVSKGFLKEEMVVVTDVEGIQIEGTYKPSSELKLHLAAYNNRSDVKAVVHAHAPYTTAFAVANKEITTKGYSEMITFFDKIPLAEYGTPGTDEIYKGVLKYILDYDIILLANHGIMAVGKDIYDAFFKLEAAENIAKILLLARQMGGEKDLPDEKLEELIAIRNGLKSK